MKSKSNKIALLVLTVLMVIGVSVPTYAARVKVSKVTVKSPVGSKKIVYVAKGKKVKLATTVTVKPSKKSNKTVTYKSKSRSIATVSSKGVIKGVKRGTTKITVTSKKNKKKKATITVKVVNPVKKVSLNKKKATIYIGNTLKLKSKIKVGKGGYKGIKWSSSKKSTATVTQKGVVKGKKAGTVSIKATAVDGSRKSATCKVTIKKKVVLTSISGLSFKNSNGYSYTSNIAISLNQAKALKISDFTINVKQSKNGIFNKTIKVKNMYTTNNKDYTIELEESVSNGEYVKCAVSGLSGTKTLEKQFIAPSYSYDMTIKGKVGDEISTSASFGNMLGYHKMKIKSGTLPSGIYLEHSDRYMYIKGKIKAVANNKQVVLSATDEKGTTSTSTINFLIGSDTVLCAQNKTIGNKENSRIYAKESLSDSVYIVGGSENYTAELVDDYGGIFYVGSQVYKGNGYGSVNVGAKSGKLAAGTYNVKVKFTDVEDNKRTAIGTLTVVVLNTHTVTSKINNTTNSLSIYYRNVATEKIFYTATSSSDSPITYMPVGTYEVYIKQYDKKIVLNKSVTIKGDVTLTYNLPKLYSITGAITDKNGEPFDDECRVRIYLADDLDTSVQTNFKYTGTYEFSLVPSGKYVIKMYSRDTNGNDILAYTSGVITVSNGTVIHNAKLNVSRVPTVTVSGIE